MHIVALIVVIGITIFVVTRDYSDFSIVIKNGVVSDTKGNIPSSLLSDFSKAIENVKSGKIMGYKNGAKISLKFTGEIGEPTQQRLRNILGVYQR